MFSNLRMKNEVVLQIYTVNTVRLIQYIRDDAADSKAQEDSTSKSVNVDTTSIVLSFITAR